jgi:hypothetical protein
VGFAAKQNPHRPHSARVLVLRARRVTAFIVTNAGALVQTGFLESVAELCQGRLKEVRVLARSGAWIQQPISGTTGICSQPERARSGRTYAISEAMRRLGMEEICSRTGRLIGC